MVVADIKGVALGVAPPTTLLATLAGRGFAPAGPFLRVKIFMTIMTP